ncbi:nucleotidyl transferase AbiEii/AbiGii toxin family protein [Limnoglobus roseus]|uniref:Nucleotidyl transferase AbiEii/AbiGii toxin family protein n=1 Tax=Limnoglobus roseus TaxID=2598579 RepID=A0A5C1ACP1_9BACT|nr:nucleotidyl transferase AbiEii/AbiGii toxin family protein [Limnoglobus roseus]QEL15963.1 hypothetical protein PX52LOC_02900 [Limnoglobus roseus]
MNPQEQQRWTSEVLDAVFAGLAADAEVVNLLIFKGARVLNLWLGTNRQSLDIDSNLSIDFATRTPDKAEQLHRLEVALTRAVREGFEEMRPVVFQLKTLRIVRKPLKDHPMGWDAFEVRMSVDDARKRLVGAPAATIDIAAPETLLPSSVIGLPIGDHTVRAYSLSRIAGEKLRAFLSSLPAYRRKMKRPGDTIRAKDLYDLWRIRQRTDLADRDFWSTAAAEFRVACESRFIDCAGQETFRDGWEQTARAYGDPIIPKDVPFADVETNLTQIVELLVDFGVIPFAFPLPVPNV